MLDDLEQQLERRDQVHHRGKSVADQQDLGSAITPGRDRPDAGSPRTRSRSEVEASTSSSGRPANPDHRGCRRPSHQGREEAVHDDRADHLRLVLRGPLRDRFPRIANAEGGYRRRSPRRAGTAGRRHLADPAHQSQSRRQRSLRQSEKDRYWQNLLLESIDATRTMLVHAARTGSHRVVMITSAVGGEGKTSLASHLATSLAGAACGPC